MSEIPQITTELQDAVKGLESYAERELFDEEAFACQVNESFDRFSRAIQANDFLNEEEKSELLQRLDSKIAGLLRGVLDNLYQTVEETDERFAQDIQIKMELLSQESVHVINQLFTSVEQILQSDSQGLQGITDEEFRELIIQIETSEPLSVLRITDYPDMISVQERLRASDWPAGEVARCGIRGRTVYIQKMSPDTVFVSALSEPFLHVEIDLARLSDESYVAEIMAREEERIRKEAATKQALRHNLNQVLVGSAEAITPVTVDLSDISDTEFMAVESAYNMGIQAAFQAKMQLMAYRLYQHFFEESPPETFTLDGSWGPASKKVLRDILKKAKRPDIDPSSPEAFRILIDLYKTELDKTEVGLFLTEAEINHPDYKFKNKGVFRGLRIRDIKTALIQNNFDLQPLAEAGVNGDDISEEVIDAYPRVLAVLDQLTDDPQIKASIIATMIMEKGLSSFKDALGIGRGDQKDYAYWMARNMPKLAAIWNEYGPDPQMGINSAGIMQVNYRTGKEVMREYTGQYWPKELLIDALHDNIELSTVIAFTVYMDNINRLKDIQKKFPTKASDSTSEHPGRMIAFRK